jgi:hypothetical protein
MHESFCYDNWMNILLLGGNSQRNQQWVHSVADFIRSDFGAVVVHDYSHWGGKGDFVDFKLELARIAHEVENLGDFIVFAKSVGSVLTLMLIADGAIRPKACTFAGLPVKLAEEENIDLPDLLANNHVSTTFLQNSNDPLASFDHLKDYLAASKLKDYKVVEQPGDDHSYDNLGLIRSLLLDA